MADGGNEAAPSLRSRARGSLLGGALGDALGAPVEFDRLARIRQGYGDRVRAFSPTGEHTGAFTDDTQMTLFTAEGLIRAAVRQAERGSCHAPSVVHQAYLRWFSTQDYQADVSGVDGWLITQPSLHQWRAPGTTCLSALASGHMGTIEAPLNRSKGCGGVMRMAPVGFVADEPLVLGAELAAITHGHPSGHWSAGALAHLIAELAGGSGLGDAVTATRSALAGIEEAAEVCRSLDAAVELARAGPVTPEGLETLGGGWTGEEALAIAVAAALDAADFLDGVSLAVTHSGDSDSTGAICGNILGALWGEEALPGDLVAQLEAAELVLEVADDLVTICVERTGLDAPETHERYPGW